MHAHPDPPIGCSLFRVCTFVFSTQSLGLQLAPSVLLAARHVDVSEGFCMLRNHRPTGAQTRRTLSLFDLTFATTGVRQQCASCGRFFVSGECVPWLWRRSQHTRRIANPRSHTLDTIPFDVDAPNAAVYNSASVLLLAMTGCLRVYAFNR